YSTLSCEARRSQTGRYVKSTAKAQSNIKSRNVALERSLSLFVIPAQAGIQFCCPQRMVAAPTFAAFSD
ncbi:MAG: hypothetical protein ACHQIO_05185, partial [Nevskiales bacterium]